MRKPGDQLRATAVEHPWLRPSSATGGPLAREGVAGKPNALKDRVAALLVIGLVVVMAAGWLALGAAYLGEVQRDGAAGVTRVGTIPLQYPQSAATPAEENTEKIDIAAWTPVWIGVDLAVFVGLGLFLRHDRRRK